MTGSAPGGRLADDVRRFGLLSAITVAERYAAMIEGVGLRPVWPDAEGTDGAGEAFLSLLRSFSDALVSPNPGARSVEQVVLPAIGAGGVSRGPIWVHNRSEVWTVEGRVTVSPFVGPGPSMPVEAMEIPALRPESSFELEVVVDVPVEQPAGEYHALVIISTAPEQPLALSLRVTAS